MEEKIIEFKQFIADGKASMQQKIDELVQDDRQDEARAFRASLNIYDIMQTLFDTAQKKANDNSKQLADEFHMLTTRIPASWRMSLEKAREHEDYEKIMIEEAKLKIVDEVINKFDLLFEEV